MLWVFDLDDCITTNPDFFKWWIYQLRKNGHQIIILTARNPRRRQETLEELEFWGIKYNLIYFMDDDMARDFTTQAKWKLKKIKEIKPNIWLDNNFKIYKRALGVDTDVKGVCKIEI